MYRVFLVWMRRWSFFCKIWLRIKREVFYNYAYRENYNTSFFSLCNGGVILDNPMSGFTSKIFVSASAVIVVS